MKLERRIENKLFFNLRENYRLIKLSRKRI